MSGDILGLTDDSRALSASQLHLLLHPTEEEEDAVLRKSDKVWCTCRDYDNLITLVPVFLRIKSCIVTICCSKGIQFIDCQIILIKPNIKIHTCTCMIRR